MQQLARESLVFVQDSQSHYGLIALDFETHEQILFSMKLHPVLCFGQDEYVHLSNSAPISIETKTAGLIKLDMDDELQAYTYVLDLKNSFRLEDEFSEDDILTVTKGNLNQEYEINQIDEAVTSAVEKLKKNETPSAIYLLSRNLTIQLVNYTDFEIIAVIEK